MQFSRCIAASIESFLVYVHLQRRRDVLTEKKWRYDLIVQRARGCTVQRRSSLDFVKRGTIRSNFRWMANANSNYVAPYCPRMARRNSVNGEKPQQDANSPVAPLMGKLGRMQSLANVQTALCRTWRSVFWNDKRKIGKIVDSVLGDSLIQWLMCLPRGGSCGT